jgi:SAM-dependent methyltransferase
MNRHDETRESVSRAYARAVSTPRSDSCCGPVADEMAAAPQDYDRQALAELPGDAVAYSMGCGDPLAFAEVEAGDTVVDLGCGAGIDILLAARRAGPAGRVIGVDMTDEVLEKARANIAASGLANVEVRKGLIENLPVETATVDWVISNCVINLSPEKDRVFAEIARVLKPGGRMLVSDIVVEDLPESLRRNEAIYNSCVGGAISEPEYIDGLRRAGLVDIEVRKRYVYDASQLERLAGEVLPGDEGGSCCCASSPGAADVRSIATEMAGKVRSARFYARKSGAP